METYTQSELTYISELEDRIDMLEDLCSYYAEHIKDVEYKLDGSKRALDKFFKLTKLVSENHKVADLIGAQLGDDVIDKIYDYLLSQVETTQQAFKPISEMTMKDWERALDEGWLFETEQKGVVGIIKTEFDGSLYTVLVGKEGCSWWVNTDGFDVDLEGYTILRRVK